VVVAAPAAQASPIASDGAAPAAKPKKPRGERAVEVAKQS